MLNLFFSKKFSFFEVVLIAGVLVPLFTTLIEGGHYVTGVVFLVITAVINSIIQEFVEHKLMRGNKYE